MRLEAQRIDLDCPLEGTPRFVEAAKRQLGDADAVMGADQTGIDGERPLEARERLLSTVEIDQGATEVAVRLGEIRLGGKRRARMHDRRFGPLRNGGRTAQFGHRLGNIRIRAEHQNLLEARLRLLGSPKRHQRPAKLVVCLAGKLCGLLWHAAERAVVMLDRLLVALERDQRVAEIVVRAEEFRLKLDGLAIVDDRLLVTGERRQGIADPIVPVRPVRSCGERPLEMPKQLAMPLQPGERLTQTRVRVGMPRLQHQCPFVAGDRPLRAFDRRQCDAGIEVRFDQRRLEHGRVVVVRDRLRMPPQRGQRIAEIVVRLGKIVSHRERPLEARHRRLAAAKLHQRVAEVVVGLGEGRCQLGGARIVRQRILRALPRRQRDAEIVVSRDRGRVLTDGPREQKDRLIKTPGGFAQNAEAVQRARMVRRKPQEGAIRLLRLLETALPMEGDGGRVYLGRRRHAVDPTAPRLPHPAACWLIGRHPKTVSSAAARCPMICRSVAAMAGIA